MKVFTLPFYGKAFLLTGEKYIVALMNWLKRLLVKNREFILQETLAARGLMQVLMKPRNTRTPWTGEEVREIKMHLWTLSLAIPVLLVFLLPGGSLLLPFLAEVLDRRTTKRL
ncbi:MAG: hypothetical protein K8I29_00630 [Alphaproteobacteria bacterium]|uniref:Uncharacterized protein n=1 Tax=Candidatus Nitrobium versatile TaxID=2884831 RepID=A0A953J7K7_9BACT|nr:hypothetical protein [Candidatus Nitrobium versatile]